MPSPLRAGAPIQVRITSIAPSGDGVAALEETVVHVPGTAIGDLVEAQVVATSRHGGPAHAKRKQVLEAGPARRKPPCIRSRSLTGRCGGCPLIHLDEAAQTEIKTGFVANELTAAGVDVEVIPHAPPLALGYRNRGHFVVSRTRRGHVRLGAYEPRSHDVISVDGCRVLRPGIPALSRHIADTMTSLELPVFGEDPSGLRYVTIREGRHGGLAVELISGGDLGPLRPLVEALRTYPALRGVSHSVNRQHGNAIRGEESVTVWGDPRVAEQLGVLELNVHVAHFFQLNPVVASEMYALGASWIPDGAHVWELYAGAGAFGLTIARERPISSLSAAESVGTAVEAAQRHARALDVTATFVQSDHRHGIPEGFERATAVVVNPPRRGLDAPVIDALREHPASRLVYMSCNARSLARDLVALTDAGWQVDEVHAFDMLPQTPHSEVLARLSR